MIIYHLDPGSGELVGTGVARKAPVGDDWLIPAHAVTEPPPDAIAGHARVWTGEAWTQVPDHRGETWYAADGTPSVIDALGTPADLSPAPPLAALKAWRVREAAIELERRIDVRAITVSTSAGTHSYGVDRGTLDNLRTVALGILLGTTPNPRPWTPKGANDPVMVTHDDLKAVSGAVGAAYDAYVQAYLRHKAAIAALADVSAVTAYDVSTGWPA